MQSLVDRHSIIPVTERPIWKALERHCQEIRKLHLRDLFAGDPKRGERLTAEAEGIYLDYSKNRITNETVELLGQLAEESGVRERIDAMFRGEKINVTENRAVLHVALRAPRGASIVVDGQNVVPKFMPCSTRCLISVIAFEPARGRARPGRVSGMSSTSALAGRTWAL